MDSAATTRYKEEEKAKTTMLYWSSERHEVHNEAGLMIKALYCIHDIVQILTIGGLKSSILTAFAV